MSPIFTGIRKKLYVFITLILFLGVILGVYLVQQKQIFKPRADTSISQIHRIGVRTGANGKGEFYDKATNQEFILRGNNFIKLADQPHPMDPSQNVNYHSTFDPGRYDPTAYETALEKMHQDGYNSVRVFINQLTVGNPQGGLSTQYLQNTADYVRRAKNNNIYVMITFIDIPWTSPTYGLTSFAEYNNFGGNGQFLNQTYFNGKKRYVKDFVAGLKSQGAPMEYVLYTLDNEISFNLGLQPFSQPTYTAPNGIAYNPTDPNSRKQMMDANMVYATNVWRAAILEADPEALVGIGFFSPKVPGANTGSLYVNTYWTLANPETGGSSADFVDLHIYPDRYPGWSVASDLDAFQIAQSNTRKPLVIAEFGAEQALIPFTRFNEARDKIVDIQVQTCQAGFKGWIFWQYDYPSDYNLLQNNGALNAVLAPVRRANPCNPEINLPTATPTQNPTTPPTSTPGPTATPIHRPSDLNNDGIVNSLDALIAAKALLQRGCSIREDVNGDCVVNVFDVFQILRDYT